MGRNLLWKLRSEEWDDKKSRIIGKFLLYGTNSEDFRLYRAIGVCYKDKILLNEKVAMYIR